MEKAVTIAAEIVINHSKCPTEKVDKTDKVACEE